MKDLYIITHETGLFGRKAIYIIGYDNAVAMYADALKEGKNPMLFESEVREYGIITLGKKLI